MTPAEFRKRSTEEMQMTYSTIYDMKTSHTIADGVQSQRVCNDTIRNARQLAADRGRSVIVEDHGTQECYRVTPAGYCWRAPRDWRPSWEQSEE